MVVGGQMLPQLDIVSEAVGTVRIRGEKEVEKELILMVAVSDNLDRFRTGVLTETPTTGEDHIQIPPGHLSDFRTSPRSTFVSWRARSCSRALIGWATCIYPHDPEPPPKYAH